MILKNKTKQKRVFAPKELWFQQENRNICSSDYS